MAKEQIKYLMELIDDFLYETNPILIGLKYNRIRIALQFV
jgi:hypothetical protein